MLFSPETRSLLLDAVEEGCVLAGGAAVDLDVEVAFSGSFGRPEGSSVWVSLELSLNAEEAQVSNWCARVSVATFPPES